jgi:hypothetical protein
VEGCVREKMVRRFYCDHCSKGMFRRADMAAHESGCTMNPDRTCYLCKRSVGEEADAGWVSLAKFAEKLESEYAESCDRVVTDEDLKRIRTATNNCPACILSVLRLAEIYSWEKFAYKAELAEWNAPMEVE